MISYPPLGQPSSKTGNVVVGQNCGVNRSANLSVHTCSEHNLQRSLEHARRGGPAGNRLVQVHGGLHVQSQPVHIGQHQFQVLGVGPTRVQTNLETQVF